MQNLIISKVEEQANFFIAQPPRISGENTTRADGQRIFPKISHKTSSRKVGSLYYETSAYLRRNRISGVDCEREEEDVTRRTYARTLDSFGGFPSYEKPRERRHNRKKKNSCSSTGETDVESCWHFALRGVLEFFSFCSSLLPKFFAFYRSESQWFLRTRE